MNQAKMNSIPISLPPLTEQKRIVAKVTELLSLCNALEAKQTQAESASTQLLRRRPSLAQRDAVIGLSSSACLRWGPVWFGFNYFAQSE